MCDVDMLHKAMDLFRLNTGRYPHALHELWDGRDVRGWQGPYIDPDPRDPWGRRYILGEDERTIGVSFETLGEAMADSRR